ncbi:MAG: hypothetical protein K2K02_06045, partial [Ruminococcus sp.]|nr:hypothetical protein [Ruminococcus sp.]
MIKKVASFLSTSFAVVCIVSPISVNASNADFTYEEVTPVQEYAIERGIYTDRFLFYNGPSHPIHNEGSSGDDMFYVDYLTNASNIQVAYMPWTYYYSNIDSGRCLGMSLTSILAHNGIFSPSDIQEDKKRLIDVELLEDDLLHGSNDPVMRKIITYQMRQDRPDFWLYMHQHFSEYDESETVDNLLETAQKAHDEGKYFLIILDDGDSQFSHAVTALGLLDGEWEYEGEKYDKCIPIYDTNLLHRCEDGETISYGCDDDCSLFVNSETKKMYIPMYFEDFNVGKDFKILSLDDENFMNYKGAINPSESYNTDVEGISSVTIKNYDREYNLSVTREDGTVFDGISDCKRIFANKGKEYVFKGKDFKVQNTANSEIFGVNFMDINHAVHTDFQGSVNNIFY